MIKRLFVTELLKRVCERAFSTAINRSSRRLRIVGPGSAVSEALEARCLLTPQLFTLASSETSGDDDSMNPQMSRDGRYVAFQSDADDLAITNGTDSNGVRDVFVRDLETNETILVSVTKEGTSGNFNSFQPSISDTGRYVAFGSRARNLTDHSYVGGSHVFVRDRDTDADGVFDEPSDSRTILVTLNASDSEASANGDSGGSAVGDSWFRRPLISGDGSTIVFGSSSTNLLDPGTLPTDFFIDLDLYRAEAPFGSGVELISENFDGTAAATIPGLVGTAGKPAISANGDVIAYESDNTNIVPNDTEGFPDIFAAGVRISETSEGKGGNGPSHEPIISRNGRHIVFRSLATNLVDGDINGEQDIFVVDLETSRLALVSRSGDPDSPSSTAMGTSPGTPTLDNGAGYAISDNGRFIAFSSRADDLLNPMLGIDDSNGASDVFLLDRDADEDGIFDEPGIGATETRPVSIRADGLAMSNALAVTGGANAVSISPDGRYVVFSSTGTDLVEDGADRLAVYLRDTWTGTTTLVGDARELDGPVLLDSFAESALSSEPLRIVFHGDLDIDPNVTDTNLSSDLFVYESPADIRMRGVVGDGYDQLQISYEVQNSAIEQPFEIGIYRSADGNFNADKDTLLDTILITGTDLDLGGHELVRQIGAEMADQIILPGVGSADAAIEDDQDYQILFVADHLNIVDEFDDDAFNDDAFNDDNSARFVNAYHLPDGPVFVHGRRRGTGADLLIITEIDEALTELTLNQRTYGYNPADVTSFRFRGHEGNDRAQAAGTPDLLIGGSGNDLLRGGPGDDYIDGGIDADKLLGEAGYDTILDGMGDDFIDLGPDGGVIVATPGSDDIFLGAGDTLDFSFADRGITIDLDLDAIQTVDEDLNTITLDGVWDNFIGSAFDDFVSGKITDHDRDLKGGDGEDRINIDASGGSVTFDGTTLIPVNGGTITLTDFEDISIFNFPPITIDNSDAGYSDTGFFDSDPNFPQGVNGGVRFGTAGNGDTATWTFTGLPPGLFSVAATWTNAPDRASNATYVIKDGTTILGDAIVNQRNAPADFNAEGFGWDDLGSFDFPPNASSLTVELSDSTANGFVAADAIRLTPIDPATTGLPPQLTVHFVNADASEALAVDTGTTIDLGEVPYAADDSARPLTSTFILQNAGGAKLLLDQATITGPFTMTQSTHDLPASAAGNIKITLDTNQLGEHAGRISIPSNDLNTPNFIFDVEATIVEDNQSPDARLQFQGGFLLEAADDLFPELGGGSGYSLVLTTPTSNLFDNWITNNLSSVTVTPPSAIVEDKPVIVGNSLVFTPVIQPDGTFSATVAGTAVDLAGNSAPIVPLRINFAIDPTDVSIPQIANGIDPFTDAFFDVVADVSVPFQVAQVEFFLNGELVHTTSQEPFIGEIPQLTGKGPSMITAVVLDIFGTAHSSPPLTLDPNVATTGSISGQKWHDRNGDGIRDANEPGLNGRMIEVVDQNGQVIATTTTQDIDINGDETIDPLTEAGRYTVDVAPGSWMVREVPQDGWRQTSPAVDVTAETAFRLDRDFDLTATNNEFKNWGGRNEKWFYGQKNQQWLFVIPDGTVFEWNGSGRDSLTGREVGQLDATFHEDIARIHAANNPGGVQVDVIASQTAGDVSFGNTALGAIEGRKWNDLNANGNRDANEPWLNGWTITLEDDAGKVIGTTLTADRDMNNDQQIDPETESGWYVFEQLGSGSFVIGEEDRPDWTQTSPDRHIAQTAFDLDQALNFRATRSDFRNWGGRDERWFYSDEGWHFIVPTGDVYKWDRSPRTALTGTHVASLSAEYWQNAERLHDAVLPGRFRITVNSERVRGVNFGNVLK